MRTTKAQISLRIRVRCLDSIIPLVSIYETIAIVSVAAGQFESYQVANPEDRFSRDEAHLDGEEIDLQHNWY